MNTPSNHESKSATKTLKILSVAVLAAAFGVAPNPAFAQHGGGGGGGHSGGGGGGHASGGSSSGGGHFSGGAPVHASAPHATMGGGGRPAGIAPRAGSAGAANFNAARNHFVDPPGSISSRAVRRPFLGSSNPAVVQPRSPFLGRRRGFFFGEGGCFNGFFPGFCDGFFPFGFGGFGFGFGYGFGPWGYGFGPWGYGYDGFGYSNYGYPYDSSMSGDIEANVEGQTGNMENRLEDNPYYGAEAESLAPSLSNGSRSGADANAPLVMLYLKDGTVYALSNYWVADGKLHYKTQYGGENSVPLDLIDIQHTVDVNAKRGVNITLRPAPDAAPAPQSSPAPVPDATPAPQPNAAPAPQPDASPNSAADLSRQLR